MQVSSSSAVISAKWFGYGSKTQMSLNACVYITEQRALFHTAEPGFSLLCLVFL